MSENNLGTALEQSYNTLSGEQTDLETTIKEKTAEAPVEDNLKYPRSWSKEYFADYDTLPDKVKGYLKQRDRDINSEIKRAQDAERTIRGEYEPINNVLAPHLDEWKKLGVGVQDGIKELVEFSSYARNEPLKAIEHILKGHGATWEDLIEAVQGKGQPQTKAAPVADPRVDMLMKHYTGTLEKSSLEQVNEFSKDKPLFNEVAEDMIKYVEKGHDLEKAYLLAIHDNPSVKATYEQQLFDARLKEKNDKAQKAKSAAFNPSSRPIAATPTNPTKQDMNQVLSDVYDKLAS